MDEVINASVPRTQAQIIKIVTLNTLTAFNTPEKILSLDRVFYTFFGFFDTTTVSYMKSKEIKPASNCEVS